MFKSARWRSDKNKIKCVFKLQFHATQLVELGGDALMISVIPADVGKPTSRLERAKVRDGSCYWEKPLYETVKFTQDLKTGKFHEKIYYFVVAKDSSRFGGIGEVSIDFTTYAEATKLSTLSLPLKNANSSAVLHVLIQRVQGSFDQREINGSENSSHHDQSLMMHFGNGDLERSIRRTPTEDQSQSGGSDLMLLSSNTNSGPNTPREREPKITKATRASSMTIERSLQLDWLNGSAPKISTDDSSTSTLGETSEESPSVIIIQKLKAEVATLTRQVDVSELELQTLRKQIVKEMKKGQDLSKEVTSLKKECEKLKGNHNEEVETEVKVNGMLLIEEGDPWALLNEVRQELNHEKELSTNLRLQLEKSQESNSELLLALEKSKSKSESKSICLNDQQSHDGDDDDEEQRELEAIVREHSGVKETHLLEQKIVNLYNEIELYKRDKDELEMQMEQIALDYEILKQENHDMSYKLERSQLQEQLKMHDECPSSYTELEAQLESLEKVLKLKSKELSDSILANKELETHVKNLEEELDNQANVFESDLEDLMRAKTEQEQRAIRAEDNLRKMKLQNANAASRLQEELRRLSQKMASTFEVNEKAAMKAINEANKLRLEKQVLEDMLVKVKEDLRNLGGCFEEKLVHILDQINLKLTQVEKIKKEIENMSRIQRMHAMIQNLESENSSESLLLQKEEVLQVEIQEFERKLDSLVQKTENSQVTTAENLNLAMKSGNTILPKMNRTEEDQEDFDVLSKKMVSLKNRNKLIELQLKEMQEKYSEISIKFAEVEGERQELVMTLKNLQKC